MYSGSDINSSNYPDQSYHSIPESPTSYSSVHINDSPVNVDENLARFNKAKQKWSKRHEQAKEAFDKTAQNQMHKATHEARMCHSKFIEDMLKKKNEEFAAQKPSDPSMFKKSTTYHPQYNGIPNNLPSSNFNYNYPDPQHNLYNAYHMPPHQIYPNKNERMYSNKSEYSDSNGPMYSNKNVPVYSNKNVPIYKNDSLYKSDPLYESDPLYKSDQIYKLEVNPYNGAQYPNQQMTDPYQQHHAMYSMNNVPSQQTNMNNMNNYHTMSDSKNIAGNMNNTHDMNVSNSSNPPSTSYNSRDFNFVHNDGYQDIDSICPSIDPKMSNDLGSNWHNIEAMQYTGYRTTMSPNKLGHITQNESGLNKFMTLINSKFKNKCFNDSLNHNIKWPTYFDCEKLKCHGLCIGDNIVYEEGPILLKKKKLEFPEQLTPKSSSTVYSLNICRESLDKCSIQYI
uniref:Erythrocyte membrane protein 1, PfEMP1 n=1 Tax=Rhabditophanes sp. KR3021 TaxID=114890 RepID=A0AC35TQU4_9BILA